MSNSVESFHTFGTDEVVQTEYTDQLNKIRQTFASGRTKSVKWRKTQLKALQRFLEDNSDLLVKALDSDLRKNRQESLLFDIEFAVNDVKGAIMELHNWVKPEPATRCLMAVMDTPYIWNEPYGVCLIMGAWNYPVQLLISPAVGAIAAGNAVVFKPSDLAPATAAVMEKLTSYLDPDVFLVVNSGVAQCTELLKERFDHIFYTGSTNVGKIVYAAAQRYLTPVVLELGGKSPVYIDDTAELSISAKRIMWGKLVNAGQTCVAPDYILCPENIYDKFIDECKKAVYDFYGDNPKKAKEYGRIVTNRHTKRLEDMIQGADIVLGGEVDVEARYVAPTIIKNVQKDDPIMREEIFGPILPVIKVKDMFEAVEFINSRDKPLTSYVFSKEQKVIRSFINDTTSGSVCANDVLVHLSIDSLPFGGVGNSGIGRYHGKYTFDCFSNKKAVLLRNFNPVGEYLGSRRYPPHTFAGLALFRQLLAKRPNPFRYVHFVTPYIMAVVIGIGGTVLHQYLTMKEEQRQ
ncbi:aldehyde dehydrogenase, dimeric NADP-preferring-like isoform X3 [Varroa jacobsoni]|uniref:aldehyde dehydrogenase, dimeric NADP-preferring-like isoform X3 n=1 Tax=Varroa jacobsoni TaxID=62625 RepID=UPI000BF8961B|nr:aldehyde dehydrogenase, dimeric NADP-preferring-like isoform X3 [Varroa jacobsoni]XP_022690436.1 aldehyde dehydrogenase, dimeric NADP-preferring-like isoform X3 [Varroa jacobsoni]XP_022690437.1 aldehyde dehydrogenase, dimeric NADP-preferring-like isoform X3 [Varroa jacobsoni]